ncbi:MAG TPA: hypothetical protein VMR34_01990 [Candidatus Saccharimonadales bacterium]|nr:hypothetical protein [Candidatus Saccharimonadales bacterium]
MKLIKLDQKGVTHYLVAAVAVLAIAAVGTYVMTQTHAATPSSVTTTASNAPNYKLIGTLSAKQMGGPPPNKITMSFYACIDKVSSSSWTEKTKVVMSNVNSITDAGNYYAATADSWQWPVNRIPANGQPRETSGVTSGHWTNNKSAVLQMTLNPKVNNYLNFQGGSDEVNPLSANPQAGNLPSC